MKSEKVGLLYLQDSPNNDLQCMWYLYLPMWQFSSLELLFAQTMHTRTRITTENEIIAICIAMKNTTEGLLLLKALGELILMTLTSA